MKMKDDMKGVVLAVPGLGESLLPFLQRIVHAYAWRIFHWGLPLEKAYALFHLHTHPDAASPAQVAEACCIPRQTMTALLDSLEKDGLAVRTPHPTDRRKKVVKVTARGARTAEAAIHDLLEIEKAAMNVIEPELLPKIRSLLKAYTTELEDLNEHQPPSGGTAPVPPYHSQETEPTPAPQSGRSRR
jgi:DNA-binding MarR family transcriptional regulator